MQFFHVSLYMHIQVNKLRDEGVKALAPELGKLTSLTSLNLLGILASINHSMPV